MVVNPSCLLLWNPVQVETFPLVAIVKILIATTISMVTWRKQPKFGDANTGFSAKWRLKMAAEISYWRRRVTTQIWVVLLIAIFPSLTTNQKHYPELRIGTSTVRNFSSHFSDVISQGNQWWCWKKSAVFSGYLTIVQFMQGCDAAGWDPSSCFFPKAPFIWRQVVMGRRDFSLQNVVNCLVCEKQKVGLARRVTRPARREGDRIAPP